MASTPYNAGKAAHQNLISSARAGLMFTYTEINAEDASSQNSKIIKKFGTTINVEGLGNVTELIVGAGFKSAQAEQSINVSQEGGLGFFDIIETIEHNVASNTFNVAKMAMRWGLLANLGLAPWGREILTGPLLSCYMYDPRELQRGRNFGYVRLENLHIQTNRLEFQTGQTTMENVTFRPNRIHRVNNPLPTAMLKSMKTLYPESFSGIEIIPETFTYNSI